MGSVDDSSNMSGPADPSLPVIVYLGNLPPSIDPLLGRLRSRFNIFSYSVTSEDQFFLDFQADSSPLSKVSGILRLGTHATTGLPQGWTASIAKLPKVPPTLKLLVNLGHGLDMEDISGNMYRGIMVCGTAGGTNSTSTVALYLTIAAFRQLSSAERAARTAIPKLFVGAMHAASRVGVDPDGKTVGIVGYGKIGKRTGQLLAAIGMQVCCVKRNDAPKGEKFTVDEDGVHEYSKIDDMIPDVDCLVLTCPYTTETHHIIHEQRIRRMRKGVRIVNVARGKCIDEEALIKGIEDGIIGGVGLDVYENE